MDNSLGTGFMAVFAVSGSVVFLAMQVHKRLLSKFMEKMEFEIRNSSGTATEEPKKKVRFADDVVVYSRANERGCGRKYMASTTNSGRCDIDENLEAMPQNWQAMYKGILQYRNQLRGYN